MGTGTPGCSAGEGRGPSVVEGEGRGAEPGAEPGSRGVAWAEAVAGRAGVAGVAGVGMDGAGAGAAAVGGI